MEMKKKTLSREEEAAIADAKKEGRVRAENLLEEIRLVLKDYFMGEISTDIKGLKYSLLNGQTFIISAEEL